MEKGKYSFQGQVQNIRVFTNENLKRHYCMARGKKHRGKEPTLTLP
jgi:hypothetical protein